MRPPLPVADAEARNCLGLALAGQARLQEACLCFEEALRLQPDYTDAHHNLGSVCRQLGRPSEAEASFRQVLRLRPDLAPAHYNLGLALAEQGRLPEAIAEYHAALHLRPDLADAHNNLGSLCLQMGRLREAEGSFQEVLRLRPQYAEAWYNFGLTLLRQERPAESVAAFREALRLRPAFVEAHNQLGAALAARGQNEEALGSYRQALGLDPNFADAACNLAFALCRLGRFAEAEAGLRRVLPAHPQHASVHAILAYLLWEQGRSAEAAEHCQQAIRANPEFADPHYNLSLYLLLQGNFEQGWPAYEWRLKVKELGIRLMPQPRWDGSRLEGKTILLVAEQGLGDTLQFIRYAPLVQQRGGRVLVWTFSPLASLLRTCPGIDGVFAEDEQPPPVDVHAHLLSLPLLLGKTTLATIPANVPYLFADPERVEHWRRELSSVGEFKIGIVWQGSPDHKKDRLRSVSLSEFTPLARLPGVRLFSLQVGPGCEQLATADFSVVDLGGSFDPASFADAAAAVMNLDLVVTVDTALAHLAGALGVPVWVALPFRPDWRWLLERADSPWYPSMRLFRQAEPGQWASVFQQMAAEIPHP